jgi:riboflavin kinase/FMN adenylyltransferase
MRTYQSIADIPDGFGASVVTIGKFDGVHTGHRQVLRELADIADAEALQSVVVTFDRNPLSVLRPEDCPEALVSLPQKLELISQLRVDATLVLEFTRALSELSPDEFVSSILVSALHARVVLVGEDFRFGAGGTGTVSTLRDLGERHGFSVRMIEDIRFSGGRRASSTWVRELLAEGRVVEAAEILGYEPSIRSVVVHGLQRGRALGYPTANLAPQIEGFIPADGVYAAWATVGEDRFPAAVSIGNNPTFDGVPEKQVEAHLLDQDLDLYDRVIEVSFVEYVRGMSKFANVLELSAQMNRDEERIRGILGVAPRL